MSRILVADDNSNIQKMVALALKDEGIDVVAVGNGDAAMRKIPDLLPDLVLADIFMPVRNGYEVCEFVKNDSRYMNTPVVLLVGAFDPLDEDETQRVHADGVLKKPFVPPDPLINMVKALLAKSNGQNHPAVVAAAPAPPVFEPQATVAIPQPPSVREAVAPAKVSREQNQTPKSVAPAPSYASEAGALDEAEEVTTAVRDPNLGEPFWAAPEEAEQEEHDEEQTATQPEEMLDMHSFGKDEERGETARFRPDSTMFEKVAVDDGPAEKKKKGREVRESRGGGNSFGPIEGRGSGCGRGQADGSGLRRGYACARGRGNSGRALQVRSVAHLFGRRGNDGRAARVDASS